MYEKGDLEELKRDPGFRIIGCMNPGSDIGKKELPENVRLKFTELFIPDITDERFIVDRVRKAKRLDFFRLPTEDRANLLEIEASMRAKSDRRWLQ